MPRILSAWRQLGNHLFAPPERPVRCVVNYKEGYKLGVGNLSASPAVIAPRRIHRHALSPHAIMRVPSYRKATNIVTSWSLVLLIHACVFGLVDVLFRLAVTFRRTGAVPLSFGRSDSARDFTARCFYGWLPLVDFAGILFYAYTHNPGPLLWNGSGTADALRWIGTALLWISLAWICLAQSTMGRDWKMGVDDRHDGTLLTSGVFARSRHPVYLGIRLMLFGQLLVIQSWPALGLWLVSEILVQTQARFEEEAMVARHGDRYAAYCSAVRRWL